MSKVLKFSENKDLELNMLDTLLRFARAGIEKYECLYDITDCIQQLKSLPIEATSIELRDNDIDFIRKGYEFARGQRPEIWYDKCIAMLRQVGNK